MFTKSWRNEICISSPRSCHPSWWDHQIVSSQPITSQKPAILALLLNSAKVCMSWISAVNFLHLTGETFWSSLKSLNILSEKTLRPTRNKLFTCTWKCQMQTLWREILTNMYCAESYKQRKRYIVLWFAKFGPLFKVARRWLNTNTHQLVEISAFISKYLVCWFLACLKHSVPRR